MLRKIRIVAATICFTLITLLFLDFTGTLHLWFGWLAKIQFLPAVLALNVGVVVFLVILTLLFGRVYCSVICPLGVFQDIVSWISGKRKKNRFRYSPAISWLRYSMLALFIVALLAGFTAIAALIAPYSAYGRIASNLFAPLYPTIIIIPSDEDFPYFSGAKMGLNSLRTKFFYKNSESSFIFPQLREVRRMYILFSAMHE